MSDFDNLSLVQKYTLLSKQGRLAATLIVEQRKVNLYLMKGKYYEVRFDAAGNLIDSINEIKGRRSVRKHSQGN
jgi:hypothetical protein